jgi:hypothetical protein
LSQYIHIPFAIALLLAVCWTTLFSFSSTPGIRGYRNLGILASYVLFLAFLFAAGWKPVLITWAMFGILGGALYICWEVIQGLRTPAEEEKPAISFSPLIHGLFAWPIMVPEAVEYSLAEFGILNDAATIPSRANAKPNAAPNGD